MAAPTTLEKIRYKKGWTLLELRKKVKNLISYPTLIMIDRGYRMVKGKKVKYNPNPRTLRYLAEVCNVKPSQVYEPRHEE